MLSLLNVLVKINDVQIASADFLKFREISTDDVAFTNPSISGYSTFLISLAYNMNAFFLHSALRLILIRFQIPSTKPT